jgi:anti-sigma regulatory factor (Ser/Thr protein kinase)
MLTATGTRYEGTFHGRADEVARVRKEIAAYACECPVADDLVLIADELASNSILHTKSRGGFFRVRCELSPGSVRVEVEDMGGPWRKRKQDDRPHGLDIVEALTGPDGWGAERTPSDTRVVWATLEWSLHPLHVSALPLDPWRG